MRVALFVTCFNDTLFPGVGRSVVTLLERLGCSVEFPLEQTCCGQMHVNSGYEADALTARFRACSRRTTSSCRPRRRASRTCATTYRERACSS